MRDHFIYSFLTDRPHSVAAEDSRAAKDLAANDSPYRHILTIKKQKTKLTSKFHFDSVSLFFYFALKKPFGIVVCLLVVCWF
jgi:hypothetical protein